MSEPNIETTEHQPTAPDPYAAPGIDLDKTRAMEVVNPVRQPDEDDLFTSDQTGLREAAEKVSLRREPDKREFQAKQPVPVEYREYRDGKIGVVKPADETISTEQGASDLTNFRNANAALELDAAQRAAIEQLDADAMAAEIQQAVDQPPPSEAPQPQPDQPAQPEQPVLEGDNIWQDPRVIAGISEYTNQVSGAFKQAEAKFAAELQANAAAATATIFSAVPELQGLQTAEQLHTALGIIERQNPERAQSIRAHIQNVQQLSAKAQEVQQQQINAQQQQYRQQFDHVAAQADDAYDKWITAQEPPERIKEITATAKQMLREAGLSDQEMSYHWSTNPILRSFAGQQIMADAARYRMSRQAARGKAIRQVPVVQRPGSPVERSSDQEYALRDLNQKLNTTHSAKDAAALLTARRGRR